MEAYLDNAATTKVCPAAVEAAVNAMSVLYGNPSSSHAPGRAAKRLLEDSRGIIASAIGAEQGEICFTSGGTESDNWALLSGAGVRRRRGKHIISSAAEHDAVLSTLSALDGFDVTLLKPDALNSEGVLSALRDDTVLISLMHVNNETGAITDIGGIFSDIRRHGSDAVLHTDAVQSFMKLPINVRTLGADLVSLSAHKIHGMKGAGALYIKKGFRLPPLLTGGGQESGRRSGTEALPQIAAFAAAAGDCMVNFSDNTDHMRTLREHTEQRILSEITGTVINGNCGRAPHILSLSLPGYKSEVLLNYLDRRDVSVSKGSACKKGARSHVLEAMGLAPKVIDGSIRVSFSRFSTMDEADYFCDMLLSASRELRTVLGSR